MLTLGCRLSSFQGLVEVVEMTGTNDVQWVEFRRWTGRWRDAIRLGLAPDVRLLGLNHSDRLRCCAGGAKA